MEKVLIARIAVEGAGLMIFGTGSESAWLIGGALRGMEHDPSRSQAKPLSPRCASLAI